MTVPLDLDALDKQHGHRTVLGSCRECMKPWPCPTSTLIRVVRKQNEALVPLCELNRDITAQSILSTCFVGDHPYTKAGEAIEKLAERGYSIVPTPCRHSIYHHGCPSCDRQDPEARP